MKLKSYLLLGFAALAMTACDKDFDDWGQQATNTQPDAVTFGSGSVASVALIDFANIPADQDSVKVCAITAPMSSYDATENVYVLTLNGPKSSKDFKLDAEGRIVYADFVSFVEGEFGKNPNYVREMTAIVTAYTGDGKTAVENILATSGTFSVKAKVNAPFIDPNGYYIVGDFLRIEGENPDEPVSYGWDQKAAQPFKHIGSDDDLYANPEFSIVIETTKADQYWKIIPANNYNGDFWKEGDDGVVGVIVDGDDSMEGSLTTTSPKAGKIAEPAKYKMTINLLEGTYKFEKMEYAEFVYFIGATDGWTNAEQKLQSPNFDGYYTGYVYCADPNGWGNEFKFQRVAGSWDNQINSGTFSGGITDDFEDGGDNIRATAGEGVYYVEMDLVNSTLKATYIKNMNLVGQFNGWNSADDAQQMTWNGTDYCWEITGAGVSSEGWKFTANDSWDINLGGDIANLTQGGSNLNNVGTTIKLYPTRRTSDRIYATVE